MNKLSLFSGIGGIDLAAKWADMTTVAFCEIEPFCQRVLRKHWPGVPIIPDVRNVTREEMYRLDIGTVDIISAGYPCQPFSHAGKRRGTEDDRHLWPEVARILDDIRPRWFVGENVAGHISLGLDEVLADLDNAGYTAQAFLIPACAVGARHRRDRVFIVGYTKHDGSHGTEIGRSTDSASHNHQKRTDETGEPSGASGRKNCATMGHTTGTGFPQWGQSGFAEDATKAENVADTSGAGCEECDIATVANRPGHGARGGDAGGTNGSTQPGMGGMPDELSDWLDGDVNPLDVLSDFVANYPQPALMGQPQYDWEPPRVATGVKNRAARLKALGNAVDPLQIYPIMAAIKRIEDWIREGRA